jgi:hypothetical protein
MAANLVQIAAVLTPVSAAYDYLIQAEVMNGDERQRHFDKAVSCLRSAIENAEKQS